MIIQIDGLKDLERYLETAPDTVSRAASMAINKVAGGTGLTMLRKQVYDEINFPNGYLDKERLGQRRWATPSKLEATVSGRDRPTSLARFAPGQTTASSRQARGVRLQVKKGSAGRTMPNAWLMRLRNNNIGLAVRLKPGQTLNKRKPAKEIFPNVFLLYGPSVDQVFRGVAADKSDAIADMLENEFLRNVVRL